MDLHELDFELPDNQIAQFPASRRDHSRMMCYSRKDGKIVHTSFFKLSEFLEDGDVMVLNDTRVIKARVVFKRPTGGKMEMLFLSRWGIGSSPEKGGMWECLVRPARKVKPGLNIELVEGFSLTCVEELGPGRWIVECSNEGNVYDELERLGQVPLPPYIQREEGGDGFPDDVRYQTVYGKNLGSVAAPTAGLHFTERILKDIREKGITIVPITLHIGYGTFSPIREERVEDHRIHSEFFRILPDSAHIIREQRKRKGRIIAIGTSVVRTLETAFDDQGEPRFLDGLSDLFIYPGYKFKMVNAMITNFHLPRSSLITLVMAFCGVDELRRCYRAAVKEKYRFFSYGDVMLIT